MERVCRLRRAARKVQTGGMHDFENDLPYLTGTVAEHSLPREWRDRCYRKVGSHSHFACDVTALACGDSWLGGIRPEDLKPARTEVTGADQKKGINDIAWSAAVPVEWQDGSEGGEQVIVVIEVQWTVQWGMPLRVMQYEAMRAWQMLQGREPLSRIKTIVFYIGERPWDANLDAGMLFAKVHVGKRPCVLYDLVELQRLEAGPGEKNLAVLLSGVVRGDTLARLTEATEALALRLAEVGDTALERDMFELVQCQAQEQWPAFDWHQCADFAGMVRLLKEDAMTWPEKWMTQMRPNWKEEVWTELRTEVRPEVEAELRPQVKAELREEVRNDLREELRSEVKQELREEILAEKRDR